MMICKGAIRRVSTMTLKNEKTETAKSGCVSAGTRGIPSGTQLIGCQNDELVLKKQVCVSKAAPA